MSMLLKKNTLYIILFLIVCTKFNVTASIPFEYITDKDFYRLTISSEIYIDSTNTFQIQDILSNTIDERFLNISVESNKIILQNNQYTYWIRLALKNTNRHSRSMIFELDDCTIDKLQLFQIKNGNIKISDITGDKFPFETRSVISKNFAFDINIESLEIVYLYIKINNSNSTNKFSLNLFSSSKYIEGKGLVYFLNGMYYSFLIFILILMLILIAVFPEVNLKSNIYFIFIIAFWAVWSSTIDGLGFQYLWPYTPSITESLLYFLPFLSILFLVPFLNETFETQQNHPKYYKIMHFFSYVFLLTIIITFNLNIKPIFIKFGFIILGIIVIFVLIKMIKQIALDRIYFARFYIYAVSISLIWLLFLLLGIFTNINLFKYEILFKLLISIQLILLSLGQIYIIKQKFTLPHEMKENK